MSLLDLGAVPCQCVAAFDVPAPVRDVTTRLLHRSVRLTAAQSVFSLPELVDAIILSCGFVRACILGAPVRLVRQLYDRQRFTVGTVSTDAGLSGEEAGMVLCYMREMGARPADRDFCGHEVALICEVFAICRHQRYAAVARCLTREHVFRITSAMGAMEYAS
jgi:hypothetical protein